MPKILLFLFLFSFVWRPFQALSQYAPQVGKPGCLAVYKDSSIIKAWATGCTIKRGWQNSADTILGIASAGEAESVTGAPGNGIVSLGDGGEAAVFFDYWIRNDPGADFVVFENGFSFGGDSVFLELAFVEVSSDGKRFVRFPVGSLTDTAFQVGTYGSLDAAKINNLAGKYIGPYGTPFDLEELKDSLGLDVNAVKCIRLIDVVGSMNPVFGSRDANNRLINDPWPTPFPSSGFDLDAVGVIHQDITKNLTELEKSNTLAIYPNPIPENGQVFIYSSHPVLNLMLSDLKGVQVQLNYAEMGAGLISVKIMRSSGLYFLHIQTENSSQTFKILIQNP